ncbi:hypothetical protein [Formosa maritima]|uniref:Uncharacterized protein n=1 Tax=Formosa maritima TaxID=2592046 RepID=A0A5D0G106_9FLAO|nr:hypothetical protein [Formosa maritima]TYA52301.1 hypothetical protein FVF61_13240 [Formosa maritima]
MKISFIISLFISQLIFLAAFSCTDDDEPMSCEEREAYINEQRDLIRAFAETSICSEDFECRYIAFGNKPCGGPWEFLIYTTSIDTLELTYWVNDFNLQETTYNQDGCGGMSTCDTPVPPIGFDCIDNKCIPIY